MGFFATLRATDSNRLFWSIMQQILLEQIPIFSPLFIEVLHVLGVVIWIHNSCCFSGTTIQARKHQKLEFITFIPSFSHTRICISKWKNNFSFGEKNLNLLCFSSIETWIYTQFKCLNGIGDSLWSFMTMQQAHV